jgi:two-component sensor histidine kinase
MFSSLAKNRVLTFYERGVLTMVLSLILSATTLAQSAYDPNLANEENIAKGLQRTARMKHENRDSTFAAIKQIRSLIKKIGSDSLMVISFFIEADAAALEGEFEKAIALVDTAYEIAKDQYSDRFRSPYLYNKARFLEYSNKKDSALVYLFKYREYRKGTWPRPSLSIGEIYADLGDRKTAEIYLEEALEINRKFKPKRDYLFNIYAVLQKYREWNDYEKIAELETEYLNYKIEQQGTHEAVFSVNSHTSTILPGVNFKTREKEILSLLPLYKRNKNTFTYVHSVFTLSKLYIQNNQHYKAYPLLDEAIELVSDLGYKDLQLNLEQQAYEVCRAMGKNDEAVDHLEIALLLKDSIRSQEIRISAQDLATKYETEKTQHDLALLQAQDEINSSRLNQLLLASALLVLLFSGLLYFYINNRSKNKQLASKNKLISKALKEKEVLLREIHHRVKNNLQVISSLLNLQSNYISDDVALKAINDGKNRVNSMALIHQKLYQEKNLTGINAQDYFSDLVENLCDTYNISENEINIQADIAPLFLDVDTMVPLGLITNELVSNALKHAFDYDDSKNNKIRISLNEENESLVLRVADNGIGIDKESFLNSKSFGNKLIQAFLPKLNAQLNIEKDQGTEFEFIVKKYEIAA